MSSRVQLALNVADLEASVAFYATLFATAPHKRRPGYANFEVAEPPLKLVLIEVPAEDRATGVAGALNHLGVEVNDVVAVDEQAGRLRAAGLAAFDNKDMTCPPSTGRPTVLPEQGRAAGIHRATGRLATSRSAADTVSRATQILNQMTGVRAPVAAVSTATASRSRPPPGTPRR